MLQKTDIFQTVPRIVFGVNCTENLGKEIKQIGATRVAIITDPGLVEVGIDQPVIEALKNENIESCLFKEVEPDPRIETANKAAAFVKEHKADLIVGLGGGSAMDIAKAAAVICTNPDPIETYSGINLVPKPGLPVVLIPTTAGTGSEVTSISVLSNTEKKIKAGVVSDYMFARCAFLDPALTVKLPPPVTASTGLDALVHAMESYVGKRASFITEPLAFSAMEMIAKYLRRAYADGSDIEARSGMLQGSLLAGLAFANTQTGAAHACSHSLGAFFHIPHGIATALMLPAVMKFNCIAATEKFSNIASAFGENIEGLSPIEAANRSVDAVVRLIEDIGFQLGLENYGVTESDIPALTDGAILPAARLWNNNPRSATKDQVAQIFRDSFMDKKIKSL